MSKKLAQIIKRLDKENIKAINALCEIETLLRVLYDNLNLEENHGPLRKSTSSNFDDMCGD